MSVAFWSISAVLVLLALLVLLWPLLRRSSDGDIGRQAALLRDQLDALKSAHATGLLTQADFDSRKQALSEAALALVDAPVRQARPLPGVASATAIILLVALPLLTLWLYQQIGNPNAMPFAPTGTVATAVSSATSAGADAQQAPDLTVAAERLAERLQSNPNDAEGWLLLGRTYRSIERFAQARDAFARASALVPETPDMLSEYAEAMGLAATPRGLAGEPESLLDRALELDPNHQRSLWLKGFALRQSGNADAARGYWERLLTQIEPGTPVADAVQEQLALLPADGSAQSSPAAPATASARASAVASPASSGGISIRVGLAPELQGRLSGNEVLFVFARAENGPPMPLAIQRLPARGFPVEVRLDESMGMAPGLSLGQFERVVIGARVSFSGNAQPQPGDLEKISAGLAWRDAAPVDLLIDTVR